MNDWNDAARWIAEAFARRKAVNTEHHVSEAEPPTSTEAKAAVYHLVTDCQRQWMLERKRMGL